MSIIGFAKKSSAPASRERAKSSLELKAVTIMSGMWHQLGLRVFYDVKTIGTTIAT